MPFWRVLIFAIDDVIHQFIDQVNKHHPSIKTVEVPETTFSDTTIYRGEGLNRESVLDLRNHFKPTETFQFTFYVTCHPAGAKKGSTKRKESRLLGIDSSKQIFVQNKIGGERQRKTTRKHFINTLINVNCLVQQAAAMIDKFVSYGVSVVSLS